MKSIRSRIALALSAVVLLVGALAFVATDRAYRLILDTVATKAVADGERGFEGLARDHAERLALGIDALGGDEAVRDAFRARERAALLGLVRERFDLLSEQHGISRLYFYEPDSAGTVFLRGYLGEQALDSASYGDSSGSRVLRTVRAKGLTQSGLELGRSALSLRVISPYRDVDGSVLGYIGMAERVQDYLASVSQQTGDEYALFVKKAQLDRAQWDDVQRQLGRESAWDQYPDVVMVESTFDEGEENSPAPSAVPVTASRTLGYQTLSGRTFVTGVFPVRDSTGQAVGEVFVRRDLTELSDTLRQAQLGLVIAFLVLASLAAFAAVAVVDRLVFRPLDALLGRSERMSLAAAAGLWEQSAEAEQLSDDEFGRFERFFSGLMSVVSAALRKRHSDEPEP